MTPLGTSTPKCDAKIGPKKGSCPVAKCAPAPEGCKLKTEFVAGKGDSCCPKPCNYVDSKGKKCTPKICKTSMINPNACKCGAVTTKVDGCPVTKCKADCAPKPGSCGARDHIHHEFKAWIYQLLYIFVLGYQPFVIMSLPIFLYVFNMEAVSMVYENAYACAHLAHAPPF